MKKITQEELKEILENHSIYIKSFGKKGIKADLKDANLECADLKGAYLRNADLTGVDLRNADLRSADLTYADLTYADLTGANVFNTSGNKREIKTIQTEYYIINITKYFFQIGCKQYTIEEIEKILNLDNIEEFLKNEDYEALEFYKEYKDLLIFYLNKVKKEK